MKQLLFLVIIIKLSAISFAGAYSSIIDYNTLFYPLNCLELRSGSISKPATVFRWENKNWVATGVSLSESGCVVEGETKVNVQKITAHSVWGISLYEINRAYKGQVLDLQSRYGGKAPKKTPLEVYNSSPEGRRDLKKITVSQVGRHYFGSNLGVLEVNLSTFKNKKNIFVFKSAGATLNVGGIAEGIYTNSTITLFEGYHQVLRDYEIDLLGRSSEHFRSLTISYSEFLPWVSSVADNKENKLIKLLRQEKKKQIVISHWQGEKFNYLEKCYSKISLLEPNLYSLSVSNMLKTSDKKSLFESFTLIDPLETLAGGVDPFGVSGGSKKVVSCSVIRSEKKKKISETIYFAYKRDGSVLYTPEVENIFALLKLKSQGYSLITSSDLKKNSSDLIEQLYIKFKKLEQYSLNSIPALRRVFKLIVLLDLNPELINRELDLKPTLMSLRSLEGVFNELPQSSDKVLLARMKKDWNELLKLLEKI